MAPVSAGDASISSTSTNVSGTSSLQVVLGITLPLLAVASFIPIIMIKRHLATRHIISQRSTTHTTRSTIANASTACCAQNTPRVPMTSVYIARVDYYLPPSDTGVSQTVAESQIECDLGDADSLSDSMVGGNNGGSADRKVPSPVLGLMPEVLPMVSLPSLSSMLCEFTVYADVIEPENLAEARRSSTCLLESVFSSMDVKALSFTELPLSPSLPPIQPVTSTLSLNFESLTAGSSLSEEKRNEEGETCVLPTRIEKECSLLSYLSNWEPAGAEDLDISVIPEYEVDIDAAEALGDEIEEISTSQLASTTTICSIALDSSSTLASLLAVRLSQFPPVPVLPLPLLSFVARSIVTRTSQSSLGSTITCSISAPASLNILEIQLDEAPSQKKLPGPFLEKWPCSSDPGELWDEEDDLLYSVCAAEKAIAPSKPGRHTWTAGVKYGRSDKGDLWDDEDDRRFSFAGGKLKPLDIFVSGSVLSLEISTENVLADSTLYMSEGISLADHSGDVHATIEDAVDQAALRHSESDFDFINTGSAEADLCFDFRFSSFKEHRNMKSGPSCEEDEELCYRFEFEDLGADADVNATAIYLSESSRSSLMSLVSVLDSPIRVEDPPVPPSPAPSLTDILFVDDVFLSGNLEKMFEVEIFDTAADDDDMELEPDVSYCSHIISVNHALFREETYWQVEEEYIAFPFSVG